MFVGNRQRDCALAVVLLAKLPTILPRYAYRMRALLGKARVVNDPGLDRAVTLDRRQDHLSHLGQKPFVRPAPFADKMQKRLMLSGNPRRRRHGCDRLDPLSLTRKPQPGAKIAPRPPPRLL